MALSGVWGVSGAGQGFRNGEGVSNESLEGFQRVLSALL